MRFARVLDTSPRQWVHFLVSKSRDSGSQTPEEVSPAVFVLSTGRVGTKTFAELAALASNIIVYHEPEPKLFGISRAAYQAGSAASLDVEHEAFLALRRQSLMSSVISSRGYVETSPQVTFLAPAIRSALPAAKFVHLVRHPSEVVRSGMRRGWYQGHLADRTRIVPRAGSKYAEAWDEFDAFRKNLWLWAETNSWITAFLADVPKDRYLTLTSEQLFSRDEKPLRSLYSFLETELPSGKKVQRVLSRKSNAQMRSEFPERSGWERSMLEDLEQICGTVARQFGYEL